tara:strand:- start:53 stop:682 length:630 start_codon:yes stop_codon:yes gene_type:complete
MNNSISNSLKSLSAHFNKFELKPAKPKLILKLRELYPNITDELVEFYEFCDGFDSGFEEENATILSVEEIINLTKERSGNNPLFTELIPIRNDGFWNFDCLMLNPKGKNTIVFWNGETSEKPDNPIAGNLATFFDHFVKWATTCYNKDGTSKYEYDILENRNAKSFPWPLDLKWIVRNDKPLKKWLSDKEYRLLFDKELAPLKKNFFGL